MCCRLLKLKLEHDLHNIENTLYKINDFPAAHASAVLATCVSCEQRPDATGKVWCTHHCFYSLASSRHLYGVGYHSSPIMPDQWDSVETHEVHLQPACIQAPMNFHQDPSVLSVLHMGPIKCTCRLNLSKYCSCMCTVAHAAATQIAQTRAGKGQYCTWSVFVHDILAA